MTTTPTHERARATTETAADEAGRVAGVAKGEAQAVASEAAEQVRGLADEALGQVTTRLDEQSRVQRDRLVGTLHSLGDDLEQMASGGGSPGLATDLAREVADRARTLGSHLDGREPAELLDDVRRFARRRPGTFLLGALALGVLAGRVARGAKDAPSGTDATTTPVPPPPGPAPVPVPDPEPTPAPAPTGGLDGSQAFADPVATPGESAIPPSTSAFTETDLLDPEGPMGTDAAGYGERTGDVGRPL